MEPAIDFLKSYWWEFLAIVVSPFMAVVATQYIKQTHKRLFGRKPHWLLLDGLSFNLCVLFSFLCWWVKYTDYLAAGLVATAVAILQTLLVKGLFMFIGKINPTLAEELSNGVVLDNYEDRTIILSTKTMVLGRNKKSNGKWED